MASEPQRLSRCREPVRRVRIQQPVRVPGQGRERVPELQSAPDVKQERGQEQPWLRRSVQR